MCKYFNNNYIHAAPASETLRPYWTRSGRGKDYGRRVFEAGAAKGAIGREAAAGIYLEYTVLPPQKTRAMALESAE